MTSRIIYPKPYDLIPFPQGRPPLQRPAGHDQYRKDRFHGSFELRFKVMTGIHVSTGVVAMGSDVGSRIPLVKTMLRGGGKELIIPGSSLKGVVRSVYEAITNSTLAVITNRYRDRIPQERHPCRKKERLCPASQVFGALDWQGVIQFSDARCQKSEAAVGYMPSLYRPRPDERRDYFEGGKAVGRKFYYHAYKPADPGQRGIPVQQAAREYLFTTHLHFMNLTSAELGTLAIALGQDPDHPMALKLGGGKPIGMGTVVVEISSAQVSKDLSSRYSDYEVEIPSLTGQPLKTRLEQSIRDAHRDLIQKPQLEALAAVLKWPTERKPPEGMY